jgi:hypothetical protein
MSRDRSRTRDGTSVDRTVAQPENLPAAVAVRDALALRAVDSSRRILMSTGPANASFRRHLAKGVGAALLKRNRGTGAIQFVEEDHAVITLRVRTVAGPADVGSAQRIEARLFAVAPTHAMGMSCQRIAASRGTFGLKTASGRQKSGKHHIQNAGRGVDHEVEHTQI